MKKLLVLAILVLSAVQMQAANFTVYNLLGEAAVITFKPYALGGWAVKPVPRFDRNKGPVEYQLGNVGKVEVVSGRYTKEVSSPKGLLDACQNGVLVIYDKRDGQLQIDWR